MNTKQKVIDQLLSISGQIIKLIKASVKKENQNQQSQDSQDIVTRLDHEVGQFILEEVKKVYKNISLDSEEVEERVEAGDLLIRTDPIDGTKHFAAGIPLFVTSIALKEKNKTIFGLVIDPNSGDVYHAISGIGAFKNNQPIKVNNLNISKSFVFIELPTSKLFSANEEKFEAHWSKAKQIQVRAFRTRNIGLGALALCLVANGSISAYVDLSGTSKLYDMEAGIFIAHSAGAVILDDNGQDLGENLDYDLNSEKKELLINIVVGNQISSKEIVELFKK